MGKPKGDSQERSFLKDVVSKRLEEIAANTVHVDPLELLGVAPPSSSATTATQSAVSRPVVPLPPLTPLTHQHALREVIHESLVSGSESPASEVDPQHDAASDAGSEASTGPYVATDAASAVVARSERRSQRQSQHDGSPESGRTESPSTESTVGTRLFGPPTHWVRLAWALHAYRDPGNPSQTRLVSYAELRAAVGREDDAIRRCLRRMSEAGLVVRKNLIKGTDGGSIYEFRPGFEALLTKSGTEIVGGVPEVPRYQRHSQRASTVGPSSSSNSSIQKERLLQEWSVDDVIWPEMFETIDRSSLVPYVRYMPSLGFCQDFIDKVAAVIEQKKSTPTPIADPLGFLFSCLKKMQVNPPPGWKSRAVRMLEEEERRLKQEAEDLQAARDRLERQRCEVFFQRLSEEDRRQIETQAEQGVSPGEQTVIRRMKIDQRRIELIRQRMQEQDRAAQ